MENFVDWVYSFFAEVVKTEKELSKSLYREAKLIDLEELNGYIEWRANLLLQNLGLEKVFLQKTNPMLWINAYDPENINNTKTDFFEKRVTNYSKATEDKNEWDLL